MQRSRLILLPIGTTAALSFVLMCAATAQSRSLTDWEKSVVRGSQCPEYTYTAPCECVNPYFNNWDYWGNPIDDDCSFMGCVEQDEYETCEDFANGWATEYLGDLTWLYPTPTGNNVAPGDLTAKITKVDCYRPISCLTSIWEGLSCWGGGFDENCVYIPGEEGEGADQGGCLDYDLSWDACYNCSPGALGNPVKLKKATVVPCPAGSPYYGS